MISLYLPPLGLVFPDFLEVYSFFAIGTWRTEAICPQQKVLKLNNTEGLDPLVAATISVNPCTGKQILSIKDYI